MLEYLLELLLAHLPLQQVVGDRLGILRDELVGLEVDQVARHPHAGRLADFEVNIASTRSYRFTQKLLQKLLGFIGIAQDMRV